MTLFLKYRPQTLNELDLTEVRKTLGDMVSSAKIPQALLFAGPRGSGKTSAARIIAKIVNCQEQVTNDKGRVLSFSEPCNKCSKCLSITAGSNLDIVEIDAASNRGVDDIRGLREVVKLATAGSRFKVYIIDEAHMLTLEAANALLKTLEEPPPHVIFILATTQPEKLPETIRSRTQIVVFRKANASEIERQLKRVIDGEGFKVEKGVVSAIPGLCDGSFRDAVKILEQLSYESEEITKESVASLLLSNLSVSARDFVKDLIKKDLKGALSKIESLVEKGANIRVFTNSVLEYLHDQLLIKMGVIEGQALEIATNRLKDLVYKFASCSEEVPASVIAQLPLEIATVEWCESGETAEEVEKSVGDKKQLLEKKTAAVSAGVVSEELWQEIRLSVKPVNHSIEALLRAARPTNFDGKTLSIEVFYPFHLDKLREENQRRILEEICSQVLGTETVVNLSLSKSPQRAYVNRQEAPAATSEAGRATSNKQEAKRESEGSQATTGEVDADIIAVAKEIFGNID